MLKCLGCNRPLLKIGTTAKPAGKTWWVRAVCGYPNCGDVSKTVEVRGKVYAQPWVENDRLRTEISRQEVDEETGTITITTRPCNG